MDRSWRNKIKILGNPCILDFSIKNHNWKLTTEFFDKEDAFLFYIVRIFYLGSNIPSKIFYVSFRYEIILTARAIKDLINMVNRVDTLTKLVGKCTRIMSLNRIIGKHFPAFHTFTDIADKFITFFLFVTILVYMYF